MVMVSTRRAPSLFAIAMVVALLVSSSCDAASRDRADPVCEVMVPCNVLDCTQYCINAGLHQKGFCTAKPDLQFYCCCPVVTA
ncbi:hypothetical protein SETIT_1G362200v2 [Setaria italica]|uniref:Knottin scorpion toxin-like domain-containing protein n=2 Tax=Setaria italica TaxID=4555 RepID=A0A368PTP1_SETIT|nr:hypothetical protein SETIT_1G362200v2 [Setaria italica]